MPKKRKPAPKHVNLLKLVPPTTYHYKGKDGHPTMRDGEPFQIRLLRWEGDRSLRGHEFVNCCDCGLQHLNIYEVHAYNPEGEDAQWYLNVRAHRIDAGPKRKAYKPTKAKR